MDGMNYFRIEPNPAWAEPRVPGALRGLIMLVAILAVTLAFVATLDRFGLISPDVADLQASMGPC